MKKFKAKLKERERLTSDTFLFTYSRPKDFDFKPGQFLTLILKGGNRSYSIASTPTLRNKFELLVKIIPNGLAGSYFQEIKVGDTSTFFGPGGIFTLQENKNPKVFLVTGISVAPIRSMIQYLCKNNFPRALYLFWGMRSKSEIYLEKEWKEIKKECGQFNFTYCLSNKIIESGNFQNGYVQEVFQKYSESNQLDVKDYEFYICGRGKNVSSIREFLWEEMGVNEDMMHYEKS